MKKRKKKKSLRRLKTHLHNGFILDNLKELSDYEFKCYTVIAMYADWETGASCPTQDTIANIVGCCTRTVAKATQGLEQKNLLSRTLRKATDKKGKQFGRERYFYILTHPSRKEYIK